MNTDCKLQSGSSFLTTDSKYLSWEEQIKRGVVYTLKDGSTFLIRTMVSGDIDEVLQLEQIIFSDPWTKEAFGAEFQDDKYSLAFVGFVNGILVAYAISQLIVDELHIHNLAVDPHLRRKGYGSTLLQLVLKIASLNEVRVCQLEVRRSNISAISLYKKFGFKVVGVRKQYYINENEDALLMSLFLS